MKKALLVFQSDFTYREGAVCAMYGVVKSVDRDLEIITATHEIPNYDIWSASYRLYQYMKFWPLGTIFVSVVDPGVGTNRRACVAETRDGYYIVTPDNGTLNHIAKRPGIARVREIDEQINRLKGKGTEEVSVFHGRDLFAYCAARLAAGVITFDQVGPEYPEDEIITYSIPAPGIREDKVIGIFEIGDPNFGNLWTNVPLSLFHEAGFRYGDRLQVTIRHGGQVRFSDKILFQPSFGYVEMGQIVIYTNELMNIAMAESQGNLWKNLSLGYGPEWSVEFYKNR